MSGRLLRAPIHRYGELYVRDLVVLAWWEDGAKIVVPDAPHEERSKLLEVCYFGEFLKSAVNLMLRDRSAGHSSLWVPTGRKDLYEPLELARWNWFFDGAFPVGHPLQGARIGRLAPHLFDEEEALVEGHLAEEFEVCGLLGQLHPAWSLEGSAFQDWVGELRRSEEEP